MKQCKQCETIKPETDFYKSKEGVILSKCKECTKAKSRAWSKSHPNRRRMTPCERLQQKYGITLEHKKQMIVDQDGKCAICKDKLAPITSNLVAVDHCHTTGAVRGILCRNCNVMLGLAKDNAQILESAIQYLSASSVAENS